MDASKKEGGCGACFYFTNGLQECFRLPNHNTIFHCEIYAINNAVTTLLNLEGIGNSIKGTEIGAHLFQNAKRMKI